jgi:hypothetical protein
VRRLLFSGALVAILVACSYDVNVTGIPKSIELDVPQLPAVPPAAKDAGHDASDASITDAGQGDS